MADDTKTKLTAEQEQAKREEDAAVERARRDLEERKSKLHQPVTMGQLSWLNTPEGQEVLRKSLGRVPGTQESYPLREGTSTVIVPRPFRLMLDHHHVFEVPQGVIEMPNSLVGHHFVLNHGVQAYRGPAQAGRPVVAAATTGRLPGEVTAGGRTLPQQNYANAAQALSGLTVEDWNALTDEDRARAISAEIAKVEAAALPPRAGDPTLEPSNQQPRPNPEDEAAWRAQQEQGLQPRPQPEMQPQPELEEPQEPDHSHRHGGHGHRKK